MRSLASVTAASLVVLGCAMGESGQDAVGVPGDTLGTSAGSGSGSGDDGDGEDDDDADGDGDGTTIDPADASGPSPSTTASGGDTSGTTDGGEDSTTIDPEPLPTCSDGERNGEESDVDCGGACAGCGQCQGCASDQDCAGTTACSDAGQCTVITEITVDWFTNCSAGSESGVTTSGLPAGNYRATALPSAGTVWDGPWSPPTTGWYWVMPCVDLSFSQMRTPGGTYYPDEATAFANLMATTEDFAHSGGDLVCYFGDSNCGDNHGATTMRIELLCE